MLYTGRMFKVVVLTLVLLWLLGRITGRKRRIVKNSSHLLQLILWAALIFTGFTTFSQMRWLQDSFFLLVLACVVWTAATYWITGWITRLWDRKKKK